MIFPIQIIDMCFETYLSVIKTHIDKYNCQNHEITEMNVCFYEILLLWYTNLLYYYCAIVVLFLFNNM